MIALQLNMCASKGQNGYTHIETAISLTDSERFFSTASNIYSFCIPQQRKNRVIQINMIDSIKDWFIFFMLYF